MSSFRGVGEVYIVRYAINKQGPLKPKHGAFRDAVLGKKSAIVALEQSFNTVTLQKQYLSLRLPTQQPFLE